MSTACFHTLSRTPTWIWMAGRRETVDCHLLMRKTFMLPSRPLNGVLEIGVSDQYRLFINGRWVGDGPARSEIPNIYVDRYESRELPLRKGRNVIALLLHNTMMPQHGQSLCPGGVWLELTCGLNRGSVKFATDSSWRVTEGLFVDGLLKGRPGKTFSAVTNYWMLLSRAAASRGLVCA